MRIDEVSLDRGDGDAPPPVNEPPRRGGARVVALAAILGVIGALVYFVWIARRPTPAAQPAPTTSTEVPVGAAAPLTIPDEPRVARTTRRAPHDGHVVSCAIAV